jgi:hypothetical protein
MKPLFYLLLVVLISGCGPSYHLRRMKYHERMAIAKGATSDSTRHQKIDSADLHALEAAGKAEKSVNLDSLLQACEDLVTAARNEKASNSPDLTAQQKSTPAEVIRTKIITKIQREACPTVAVDSTYNGTLSIQGKDYTVPLKVSINAKDGALTWSVRLGEVKAPFVKEEVTSELQIGDSWLKNLGQEAAALIAGLVIGFALGKMIKF